MNDPPGVALTLSLPGGMWNRIREVRRCVAEATAHLSREISAAAEMVTGELVENAVKYGTIVPGLDDVVVHVRVEDREVKILVTNGVGATAAADEVAARIARIQASPSREALYVGRLEELLRTPGAAGGLGLYRIGYEGKFELSCECVGQVLTVKATRELP